MIQSRQSVPAVAIRGVLAGLVAGLVFALAEIGLSVAIGSSVVRPFRVIGSMVQGPTALSNDSMMMTAVLTGIVVHAVLSALYGAIFAVALRLLFPSTDLGITTLILGVGYAVALWIINFLVIAPVFFDQLLVESPFWFSFTIAHAFYGASLGACLIALAPGAQPSTSSR